MQRQHQRTLGCRCRTRLTDAERDDDERLDHGRALRPRVDVLVHCGSGTGGDNPKTVSQANGQAEASEEVTTLLHTVRSQGGNGAAGSACTSRHRAERRETTPKANGEKKMSGLRRRRRTAKVDVVPALLVQLLLEDILQERLEVAQRRARRLEMLCARRKGLG